MDWECSLASSLSRGALLMGVLGLETTGLCRKLLSLVVDLDRMSLAVVCLDLIFLSGTGSLMESAVTGLDVRSSKEAAVEGLEGSLCEDFTEANEEERLTSFTGVSGLDSCSRSETGVSGLELCLLPEAGVSGPESCSSSESGVCARELCLLPRLESFPF